MSTQNNPKQRALIITLIMVGFIFIAFFGMRSVHAIRKFNGHRPPAPREVETDVELIREWMTIPSISHTYHVPEKILFDALDISSISNHEKSLQKLNQEYYPNADGYVLDKVKTTILAHQPPPIPDSVPTVDSPPPLP